MSIKILEASNPRYTIEIIQDELRQLVEKGAISRHQRIYSICQYIPAREWVCVESELEKADYLLRDFISELLPMEKWPED